MNPNSKKMDWEIPLTKNQVALVDEEDFEQLSKYRWHAHKGSWGTKYYAVRNARVGEAGSKIIKMHNEIMKPSAGMEVDHIDGNTLNNRRSNLRICTRAENCLNKPKMANNKSGYKGVHWHNNQQRWRAEIRVMGKKIHLGNYTDKEKAHEAYREGCLKYHGEFANLGGV